MESKLICELNGFEEYVGYSVTSDGRVFTHFKRHDHLYVITSEPYKELKPSLSRKGYLKVRLSNSYKKKSASVHRLVALAFLPNPDNKAQVNHIDCNKFNNDISNLEWVTNAENHKHKMAHGLNVSKSCDEHYTHVRNYKDGDHHACKKVYQVDDNGNIIAEYKSFRAAAKAVGIDSSGISKVVHGHICKAGGYKWVV